MSAYRHKRSEDGPAGPAYASELQFANALAAIRHINEIVHAAAPEIRRSRKLPEIGQITRGQWEKAVALIAIGVTPSSAAQLCFGITANRFAKWMREGGEDAASPLERAFYLQIRRAELGARGVAESRVFVENPELFLTRGPAGRTRADDPGWTDESVVKHTDPSGDKPVRVILEVTPLGVRRVEGGGE